MLIGGCNLTGLNVEREGLEKLSSNLLLHCCFKWCLVNDMR